MKNICLYFEIHQPTRLKKYRFFDIEHDHYYYDDFQSEEKIREVVEQSYLPTNRIIADMIRNSNGRFKCTFSISGVALSEFERFAPELIDSFKELASTGCVEFLAETYAHSLASIYDNEEFVRQVKLHSQKIETLFGRQPTAFRNTEMIYSDEIGEEVAKIGFNTILIEEARFVMGWKSPNYLYKHSYIPDLKLLVRNNSLSDDIAFRFSNPTWSEYPMTAEKYIDLITRTPEKEEIINIWMGYEALGIFQRPETGIYDFLKALPYHALERGIGFATPSEIATQQNPVDTVICPNNISWAGSKDLNSWIGNDLQQEALNKLYAVSERVNLTNSNPLIFDWLRLQTSDNFRYMSHTDSFGSHYSSPYEAFTNYMNVLSDFLIRVDATYPTSIDNEELKGLLQQIEQQEKEIQKLEKKLKGSPKN